MQTNGNIIAETKWLTKHRLYNIKVMIITLAFVIIANILLLLSINDMTSKLNITHDLTVNISLCMMFCSALIPFIFAKFSEYNKIIFKDDKLIESNGNILLYPRFLPTIYKLTIILSIVVLIFIKSDFFQIIIRMPFFISTIYLTYLNLPSSIAFVKYPSIEIAKQITGWHISDFASNNTYDMTNNKSLGHRMLTDLKYKSMSGNIYYKR